MFKQVNVNPLGKSVGDCTTRALAVMFYDGDWYAAYAEKCILGMMQCDESTSNVVVDAFMRNKGFKKALLPDDCPDCTTFGEFARLHPNGRYLLCTGNHVSPLINGEIVDSWDSSNEIVSFYYVERT